MQQELEAERPELDFGLLGINGDGHESGVELASEGRDLPLLQDTAAVDAWSLWDVTYRDVVVLDRENRVFGVFNLTDQDLADPDNYAELEQMIVDAAAL